VLREIFDSLDDGDFQISRAEYVRLMATRGVSAYETNATFSDMDHTGSNLMTVAKMQHYAYTKSIELISDQFKEIDMQDGSRDRLRAVDHYFDAERPVPFDVRDHHSDALLDRAPCVHLFASRRHRGRGIFGPADLHKQAVHAVADEILAHVPNLRGREAGEDEDAASHGLLPSGLPGLPQAARAFERCAHARRNCSRPIPFINGNLRTTI